jgi:hypothetical protein
MINAQMIQVVGEFVRKAAPAAVGTLAGLGIAKGAKEIYKRLSTPSDAKEKETATPTKTEKTVDVDPKELATLVALVAAQLNKPAPQPAPTKVEKTKVVEVAEIAEDDEEEEAPTLVEQAMPKKLTKAQKKRLRKQQAAA